MVVKRKRAERERGRGRGKEEEEKEDDLLKLKPWSGDTWDVVKKLNKSDLDDNLKRVILPIGQVRKHVVPFLSRFERQELEEIYGLTVRVDDLDTKSHYFLSFKKWESNGSYILGRDCIRDFVDERKLKEDDMIGMCWNQSTRGFCFSVIKRSPAYPPPDPSLCEFAREHLRLSPHITTFSVIKRSPAYPPPDPSLCEFASKHLRLSLPTPDLFMDALESCPCKKTEEETELDAVVAV